MKNMRLLISLSFEPELFTWLCLLFSFQVSSLRPKRISILSECVCVCVCARARVRSVVSDSLRSYGLWPTSLLCPWDFPGKNTGVGCHFF